MKKTIQMMKNNGLFDSMVHNIMTNRMSKNAVADILDEVCVQDETFEDTFFNDIHDLGLNIIWKELCAEADNRYYEEEARKQETIEDLLKKIIDLMSK